MATLLTATGREHSVGGRHRKINTAPAMYRVIVTACAAAVHPHDSRRDTHHQARIPSQCPARCHCSSHGTVHRVLLAQRDKDVISTRSYDWITPWRTQLPPTRVTTINPPVALIYVTCNDFTPEALSASLMQDYSNCHPVILDDSRILHISLGSTNTPSLSIFP